MKSHPSGYGFAVALLLAALVVLLLGHPGMALLLTLAALIIFLTQLQ